MKCAKCEGCNASAWDKPYTLWNLKWVSQHAPDRPIGLCGNCLYIYKHAKDFCPVCYKIYPDENAYYDASTLNVSGQEAVPQVVVGNTASDGVGEGTSGSIDPLLIDESMVSRMYCSCRILLYLILWCIRVCSQYKLSTCLLIKLQYLLRFPLLHFTSLHFIGAMQ